MEDKELSLEDLDNVYWSLPAFARDEKALEHPELYRQKQIEELKKAKETLEEVTKNAPSQGRNR